MERMMAQSTAAARPPVPKLERVLDDLRKMPLFQQLVPMEAGIGWPIPLRRDGKVYVSFPLYSVTNVRKPGGAIELWAPFASVTLDCATMRPVKYVRFAFERPWPQAATADAIGTFPHPAIATLTVARYGEHRSSLLSMYDDLLESLAGKLTLDDGFEAKFSAELRLLMEPALEPYYRALGEKFFERYLPLVERPDAP